MKSWFAEVYFKIEDREQNHIRSLYYVPLT